MIKFCLGFEVIRGDTTIQLSQRQYISELLDRFRVPESAKSIDTPMDPHVPLSRSLCPVSDTDKLDMAAIPYRELVGSLNYLATCTRPDIVTAVSVLSRFLVNPGRSHWRAARRVLLYLKGTSHLSLTYTRTGNASLDSFTTIDYRGPTKSQALQITVVPDRISRDFLRSTMLRSSFSVTRCIDKRF